MEYRLVYQLFPRSFGITEEIRLVIALKKTMRKLNLQKIV